MSKFYFHQMLNLNISTFRYTVVPSSAETQILTIANKEKTNENTACEHRKTILNIVHVLGKIPEPSFPGFLFDNASRNRVELVPAGIDIPPFLEIHQPCLVLGKTHCPNEK